MAGMRGAGLNMGVALKWGGGAKMVGRGEWAGLKNEGRGLKMGALK